jgi:beta-xylosidase
MASAAIPNGIQVQAMDQNSLIEKTLVHPAFSADFPDPFVMRVGSQYYAYATNTGACNVQVLRSSSAPGSWEWMGEGLPELPAWATSHDKLTWAPVVLERNGRYIMFYTARATDMHVQSISMAVADSPLGPFIDNSTRPLICPAALGGAIDPSPFVDVDGKAYLLWKNDGNSRKLRTSLWIQELSEDGMGLVGEPVELIHEDQDWEYPLIEGPSMVRYEDQYYLFYSANDYKGEDYAIGYAVGSSVMGPFVKPLEHAWLSSFDTVRGPGGQEFFSDEAGCLWMAYHAWTLPNIGYPGGKRSLFIERVIFQDGKPRLARFIDTPPALS